MAKIGLDAGIAENSDISTYIGGLLARCSRSKRADCYSLEIGKN